MKRSSCTYWALLASILVWPGLKSVAAPQGRPQFVGRETLGADEDEDSWDRSARYLQLSPDEKWLISQRDDKIVLWNLANGQHRVLPGDVAVFSRHSQLIASYDGDNGTIYLSTLTGLRWHKHINGDLYSLRLSFTPDGHILHYSSVESPREVSLDVRSGQVLSRKAITSSPWREHDAGDSDRLRVSFVPPGAKRAKFSFETSNEYDSWDLAPDKAHLWVSREEEGRFDIRNAKTGRKLWSYFSNDADSGQFGCYPSWVGTGKTLATIEHDTLIVRDAETGKVVLNLKNPLTSKLISWAFTHDQKTVYLMDAKGRIYRQRLS